MIFIFSDARRIPSIRTYAIPFDSLDEGNSLSYPVHIWHGKTRMAGLQSGEGRMIIDSAIGQSLKIPYSP